MSASMKQVIILASIIFMIQFASAQNSKYTDGFESYPNGEMPGFWNQANTDINSYCDPNCAVGYAKIVNSDSASGSKSFECRERSNGLRWCFFPLKPQSGSTLSLDYRLYIDSAWSQAMVGIATESDIKNNEPMTELIDGLNSGSSGGVRDTGWKSINDFDLSSYAGQDNIYLALNARGRKEGGSYLSYVRIDNLKTNALENEWEHDFSNGMPSEFKKSEDWIETGTWGCKWNNACDWGSTTDTEGVFEPASIENDDLRLKAELRSSRAVGFPTNLEQNRDNIYNWVFHYKVDPEIRSSEQHSYRSTAGFRVSPNWFSELNRPRDCPGVGWEDEGSKIYICGSSNTNNRFEESSNLQPDNYNYNVKVAAAPNKTMVKYWREGNSEPMNWDHIALDHNLNGVPAFYAHASYSADRWNDYSFYDLKSLKDVVMNLPSPPEIVNLNTNSYRDSGDSIIEIGYDVNTDSSASLDQCSLEASDQNSNIKTYDSSPSSDTCSFTITETDLGGWSAGDDMTIELNAIDSNGNSASETVSTSFTTPSLNLEYSGFIFDFDRPYDGIVLSEGGSDLFGFNVLGNYSKQYSVEASSGSNIDASFQDYSGDPTGLSSKQRFIMNLEGSSPGFTTLNLTLTDESTGVKKRQEFEVRVREYRSGDREVPGITALQILIASLMAFILKIGYVRR